MDGDGSIAYILQEVNHHVFKKPTDISGNLTLMHRFIREHAPEYFLPLPVPTIDGASYAMVGDSYYRLTPYVKDSHAIDTCTDPDQAYEAALQFGRFTSVFNGFRTEELRETIPGFHDLSFRWQQFLEAREKGDRSRIHEAYREIGTLSDREDIVDTFQDIRKDDDFIMRVTHHDTKISNVLFGPSGKGICVIDLDTVMPGYFISDLGDMYRTYLSPANEEERDRSRISVRSSFKEAILSGYLHHMEAILTVREKQHLEYAGAFMVYMQALRFLTDHLNNDIYYGAAYPGQNLERARNQIRLLELLGA
jgi:Ser/Thr protein kinase RdoA (MazF antagonist)